MFDRRTADRDEIAMILGLVLVALLVGITLGLTSATLLQPCAQEEKAPTPPKAGEP
jgi:hypothetical protein